MYISILLYRNYRLKIYSLLITRVTPEERHFNGSTDY